MHTGRSHVERALRETPAVNGVAEVKPVNRELKVENYGHLLYLLDVGQ